MSWQRLAHKSVHAYPNRALVYDIGSYLERCYLGQKPTLNRHPFISIRTIAADPEAIHYEMSSMEQTVKAVAVHRDMTYMGHAALAQGRTVYPSFWVKDVERLGRPMENPVVMSRTWLQPQPYDSLYWLSLFQVFDDGRDRDEITKAAVSRWYPVEEGEQLR